MPSSSSVKYSIEVFYLFHNFNIYSILQEQLSSSFPVGTDDIVKRTQSLRQRTLLTSYLQILSLHSLSPLHHQQERFDPTSHPNIRKMILATSITIDDVVYVVDTSRTKQVIMI